MKKFVKTFIKFIIVWNFTIWFFDYLGLPIYEALSLISGLCISFYKWIMGGSDGAIAFSALVVLIVLICVLAKMLFIWDKNQSKGLDY